MASNEIPHSGRVVAIEGQKIRVALLKHGACGGCKARDKCGMVEQQEREVEVITSAVNNFQVGDSVTVSVTMGMGRMAVILAYFLPLVLLVVLMVIGNFFSLSEGFVALIGLVGVACYYYFLYLVREKIAKEIHLTITNQNQGR